MNIKVKLAVYERWPEVELVRVDADDGSGWEPCVDLPDDFVVEFEQNYKRYKELQEQLVNLWRARRNN